MSIAYKLVLYKFSHVLYSRNSSLDATVNLRWGLVSEEVSLSFTWVFVHLSSFLLISLHISYFSLDAVK